MKKKFMIVAVVAGALALGACVDDNESASVTALRDAKAQQLAALANYYNAQAEAEKITAEAEAAYQNALAAYQNALAEQTAQEMAQAKAIYEAQLEAIKAQAEADMWAARLAAAQYEQQILDEADEQLRGLFMEYKNAVNELTNMNVQKSDYNYQLAQAQAGLLSANEYVANETARIQSDIASANSQIEAWKNYGGIDKAELEAELAALQQEEYTAFAKRDEAEKAWDTAGEAYDDLIEMYLANAGEYYAEETTVKTVDAIRKFNALEIGYYWVPDNDPNLQASINEGYLDWSDCQWNYDESTGTGYYIVPSVYINFYGNGSWNIRYVAPVKLEYLTIVEDNENRISLEVPMYGLRNNATKVMLDQYYSMEKSDWEDIIGSPASDSKLATGYYLYKEQAEAVLAEAQEALAEAQEAYPKTEAALKEASDAMDEAGAVRDAARADSEAAQKALEAAQNAYNEAVSGGDEAAITAAEEALDKANEAANDAWEAFYDADEAYVEKQNEYYEADSKYWNAKNELESAQIAANDAEREVESWNVTIANAQETLAGWDERQAAWNTMVTALEDETYAAELKALGENEIVTAYVEAYGKRNEALLNYQEVVYSMDVITNLLYSGSVMDPAQEIADLEQEIFNLNQELANLEQNQGVLNQEAMIEQLKVQIAGLEEEIAAQTLYVEALKARLAEQAGAAAE